MAGFMSDLAAEGAIQWRQIRAKGTNPKGTNPTGAKPTNHNTFIFSRATPLLMPWVRALELQAAFGSI